MLTVLQHKDDNKRLDEDEDLFSWYIIDQSHLLKRSLHSFENRKKSGLF